MPCLFANNLERGINVSKASNRSDTVVFSGLGDARANCVDCGWQCLSRNAVGAGKVHHNRTGHTVQCESYVLMTYALEGSAYVKEQRERKLNKR